MKTTVGNKRILIRLCVVACILVLFSVVFLMEKSNNSQTESTQLMEDYTKTKSFIEKEKQLIVDLERQSTEITEQKQQLLDAKERIQAFEPPNAFSTLHNELFLKYKNGIIQAIEKQLQNPTIDHAILVKETEQAIASWSVLEIYILEDLYLYND